MGYPLPSFWKASIQIKQIKQTDLCIHLLFSTIEQHKVKQLHLENLRHNLG